MAVSKNNTVTQKISQGKTEGGHHSLRKFRTNSVEHKRYVTFSTRFIHAGYSSSSMQQQP